jgi:lysophospholipase L1-like esterase
LSNATITSPHSLRERFRHIIGAGTLVAVALLASIIIAEGTLRVSAALVPSLGAELRGFDPLAILIEPHGDFGYRQRPNRTFTFPNGTSATSNALGFRGPVVSIRKSAGVFRVDLLGGSTSHGWGVNDDQTIDAHMRRQLVGAYPGRQFEVVNLGFDGYDSYQDFERLRSDGLRLQPDVVIVNSGINDVRNAWFRQLRDRDPRTFLWLADIERLQAEARRGGPTLWTRTKHWFYVARVPGFARTRLYQWRNTNHPSPETRGTRFMPTLEAADYFERNLERIASITAARGIAVLFSTPPSALRLPGTSHETSGRTYWLSDAPMTQRYRDELDRRMRSVAAKLSAHGAHVSYVDHAIDVSMFLDDCHLTNGGNERVAADFVAGLAPYVSRR